ncbi:MAG: hypothetical protein Tsb0020_26330 [Haliangiales bacterium]
MRASILGCGSFVLVLIVALGAMGCDEGGLEDEPGPFGGAQDFVTPEVEIASPAPFEVLRAGEAITVRVRYTAESYDFCNECATDLPDQTYGRELQVAGQGHGHVYFTPVGFVPDPGADAASFCVLFKSDTDGVLETTCPGLDAGYFEMRVDLTTNSHAPRLKAGPRKKPPNDARRVFVASDAVFDEATQRVELLRAELDEIEALVE